MARPAPPPALAFQDDNALLKPGAARDRLLDQMRHQGARDIRTNVIWGRIRKEGYGAYDDLVNAARARGLHVQMTLMGTPSYAPGMDQSLNAYNNDPRLWRQFAADTARHFRGRVGRYSIGNEPNWPSFIAKAATDPVAAGRIYRGIYRAGYAGVKGADRSAQVLLGELSSTKNAKTFLQAVLKGKPLKTAGLAYHPYAGGGAWDINSLEGLQDTLARYKRLGRLQTAKGGAAPLYLTEFGYQRGGSLSDRERLRKMGEAYAKAKAAGARQFLAYQLMPTQRPMVTTPAASGGSGYGAWFRGAETKPRPGFLWDTSIADASGNIPAINRGLKLPKRTATPRARAARSKRGK